MITEDYIKMCEQVPQLWNDIEHDGSLMAWRSFIGIVHKCKKRKLEGLASFIPETLVTRTWLKDDEDIMVLKTSVGYGGKDPDKGTPVYSQEQLQGMVKERHIYYLIKDFQIFQVKHTIGLHLTDMNELWLAFIMHEKYNKSWNGEKWVKINE